MNQECFPSGDLRIGCNYWASHAGIAMWHNWSPETIRRDLEKLAANGIRFLRVFPLWSDFQPLEVLYNYQNAPYELSFRGGPFPETAAGRAGMDEEMVERLRFFLDCAAAAGIQVAIGLVTGWMSGRTFTPPAFAGRNLITDPEAIHWQVRMVKYLVRTFHDHPAVAAWGPGNECNCLSSSTREQSWLWLATITGAIRSEDPVHPIASGMHSLSPGHPYRYGDQPSWMLTDQTDLVDYFTTHPYPLFTPHAMRDGIGSFRNAFHAAAEGCYYSDLGGKPCICEEFGTLAPLLGDDAIKRFYLRNVMHNLWTHGGRTLFWWCAFDQSHLDYAPYDWNAVERELGLFNAAGELKPFASVLTETLAEIHALSPEPLPERRCEAVVLTTYQQDSWGNGWGAFLLAKQAGFDVRFASAATALPESELYLLPGLCGDQALSRRRYLELLDRVKAGATLYLSLDDAILSPFNQVIGFESLGCKQRTAPVRFELDGATVTIDATRQVLMGALGPDTEVLAREADGTPAFLRTSYGAGEIFLLTAPLERHLIEHVDSFASEAACRIYETVAQRILATRPFRTGHATLTSTVHPIDARHAAAVAVNNSAAPLTATPVLTGNWRIDAVQDGDWNGTTLTVAPGKAAFIKLIC